MRRLTLLLLCAVLLGLGVFLARDRLFPGPPNIILVVIDTLRADHLGAWGHERPTSPVIDAFAAENVKFDNAFSTAPWTAPSVASMFTGLYPTSHGVLGHVKQAESNQDKVAMSVLSERLETLAEGLHRGGYRTVGITANAWVADYLGFSQGFDAFETHDYVPAEVINERAEARLDELQAGEGPFFLYLQYMDPHAPYKPPPEDMKGMTGQIPGRRVRGKFIARANRYDGEIHHVDRELGELFDDLKRRGLYERSVILLVSDHGEQFGEAGRGGHGHTLRFWETHVPLVLKAPGHRGRVTTPVSVADVYPTLLGLGGVEDGPPVQGLSLLGGELDGRLGITAEGTRGRNQKMIIAPDGRKLLLGFAGHRRDIIDRSTKKKVLGLWNVLSDPREKDKLKDPKAVQELDGRFFTLYEETVAHRNHAADQELTPETVEQLKALGYLE